MIKLENKAKKFIHYPTDETTQWFMINIFMKNILKEYANLTEFLDDCEEIVENQHFHFVYITPL